MNFNLDCWRLLDTAWGLWQDLTEYTTAHRRKFPQGACFTWDTKLRNYNDAAYMEKAEKALSCLGNALNIDAYKLARIYNAWNEKTRWERVLSEVDAAKLIELCAADRRPTWWTCVKEGDNVHDAVNYNTKNAGHYLAWHERNEAYRARKTA